MKIRVLSLLSGASAPVVGASQKLSRSVKKTFQMAGRTSAGAGAAQVLIYGSNDLTLPGKLLATVNLTLSATPGSAESFDGFANDAPWLYVWAELASISGTGATVDANCAIEQYRRGLG